MIPIATLRSSPANASHSVGGTSGAASWSGRARFYLNRSDIQGEHCPSAGCDRNSRDCQVVRDHSQRHSHTGREIPSRRCPVAGGPAYPQAGRRHLCQQRAVAGCPLYPAGSRQPYVPFARRGWRRFSLQSSLRWSEASVSLSAHGRTMTRRAGNVLTQSGGIF